MKQEDKELLLKDLCARLPYRVKVRFYDHLVEEYEIISLTAKLLVYTVHIEEIPPYLFPLSSMTEEQKEEYCNLQQKVIYNSKGLVNSDVTEYVNWCYKNHIDINNLIPMGLAIDATHLDIY